MVELSILKSVNKETLIQVKKKDGAIVFADHKTNTVYIDTGRKNGVQRGLKFDVYRYSKKGKKVFKGRLEIQKVMDKVSMALITRQKNRYDPIVTGDIISNPVFQEGKPIYFVFAGKFLRTSNENLKKLIENIGSKVEDKVTARTNFVIVGNKGEDHPNYVAAVSYGIPLMTEKEVLKYIGD